MRGRKPKPPGLRQRRNRETTAATLPTPKEAAKRKVPPLPPLSEPTEIWHPRVVEWWQSVWRSPMASEYLPSDVRGGLYALALLCQRLWKTGLSVREQVALFQAFERGGQNFGLSPMDRRRLQWQIDQGESADERTQKRRKARQLPAETGQDPREVLKVS